MHVVPPHFTGQEVDGTGAYKCPLCKSQGAGDEADTGWVSCPMVRGKMICLGCCLDHQGVARSADFEGHAFHELLETLSAATRTPLVQLRRICLQHQEEVIENELENSSPDANELIQLRTTVLDARAQLEST